jgi:hypothetical protein
MMLAFTRIKMKATTETIELVRKYHWAVFFYAGGPVRQLC